MQAKIDGAGQSRDRPLANWHEPAQALVVAVWFASAMYNLCPLPKRPTKSRVSGARKEKEQQHSSMQAAAKAGSTRLHSIRTNVDCLFLATESSMQKRKREGAGQSYWSVGALITE